MGRTSNAKEKRSQIIQALYDCLSEKGHDSVTIKTIAARANLPSGVIHYYFTSKDHIFIGLIEYLQAHYQNMWDQALQIQDRNKLVDTAVSFLAEVMILEPSINRVLYNLVQLGFERKDVREALRQTYRLYRSRLSETFFSDLPPDQMLQKASLLLAIIEGLALQFMIEPEFVDQQHVRQLLHRAVTI